MQIRELSPGRLEAFSDGVIAIIITIMVLELKIPHTAEPHALLAQWPLFLAYALSFVYVGIYWVNHHYLFRPVKHTTEAILWLNMLLLFCLSLVPFATGYVGETRFAPFAMAIYAVALLLPALAFLALHKAIVRGHPQEKEPQVAKSATRKNVTALAMYVAAIPLAYVHPAVSFAVIAAVAVMYFLPRDYF